MVACSLHLAVRVVSACTLLFVHSERGGHGEYLLIYWRNRGGHG